MGFFTRLNNGWEIAKTSMKVLNANKQLIIFPILSGLSMVMVIASFLIFLVNKEGWTNYINNHAGDKLMYLVLFLFYIINYFIVVFFNMGLMHCTKLYFEGEEVTIAKGLNFSMSRIGAIFSWAVFAATVGTLLRMIQDNAGWLGKIIISLVGIVWSVATFFVIPVLAYENVGPLDAVKRSSNLMKEKWGETIGANFSISIIGLLFFLAAGVIGLTVSALINEEAGILIFVLGFFLIITITSALHSIFISAVYNHINGNINDYFNQHLIDGLFVNKD